MRKYETIITFERFDREIAIFLEHGEALTLENIVDVEIYPREYAYIKSKNKEKYEKPDNN